MTAEVSLDFHINSSVEEVWRALTDSELLAKWIWPNTFKAESGYGFKFQGPPNEWWDGIVVGEVLEVNEMQHLTYTWSSQGETTTVQWTLKRGDDNTTILHFEQSGFSEETKAYPGALQGAIDSWTAFIEQLKNLLEK